MNFVVLITHKRLKKSMKNKTNITAIPGRQDITVTRIFNARPDQVFRLFTEPALFVEWIAPHNLVTTLETFDAITGGSYRYIHSDANGNSSAFRGIFHKISEQECIIRTFEPEGLTSEDHVLLETIR